MGETLARHVRRKHYEKKKKNAAKEQGTGYYWMCEQGGVIRNLI